MGKFYIFKIKSLNILKIKMADEKKVLFTEQWQQSVDENFNDYQEAINRTTFGLQRGQKGFLGTGSFFYPYFYQTKLVQLETLQKKQLLGKINPEEIEIYEKKWPDLRLGLKNTFNSNWYMPKGGMAIGGSLVLVQTYFNASWTFRAGTFAMACGYDYLCNRFARKYPVEVIGFLNYCLANRTANAQFESHSKNYAGQVDNFKKIAGPNANALTLHDQIGDLVRNENPKADALE